MRETGRARDTPRAAVLGGRPAEELARRLPLPPEAGAAAGAAAVSGTGKKVTLFSPTTSSPRWSIDDFASLCPARRGAGTGIKTSLPWSANVCGSTGPLRRSFSSRSISSEVRTRDPEWSAWMQASVGSEPVEAGADGRNDRAVTFNRDDRRREKF